MRATLSILVLAAIAAAPLPSAHAQGAGSSKLLADVMAVGATPGVSVVDGNMVFGPRAAARYKRVAGREWAMVCTTVQTSPRTLARVEGGFGSGMEPAPKRRAAFSAAVDDGDVCDLRVKPRKAKVFDVSRTPPIASVALTPWGATVLDRRPTALWIGEVFDAALWFEDRFATAEELTRGSSRFTVLPAPDATPPPFPAIGVWADGQGRVSVRAFTRAGYLLHTRVSEDNEAENVRFWVQAVQ